MRQKEKQNKFLSFFNPWFVKETEVQSSGRTTAADSLLPINARPKIIKNP
jgi:hypothetical protein